MRLLTLLFFLLSSTLIGQTISGFVKEKDSGETIIGVTVKNLADENGAFSNKYGFFSLSVSHFPAEIKFSSIGFKPVVLTVNESSSKNIEIELEPEDVLLNEIQVKGKQEDFSLEKLPIGVTAISIKRLKSLPMLFGEADVLKALSLTPGVSLASEGTSGILVRGGTPDQNLILLDDIPVYNVSHLFGLISVFNPDAIKNVTLYKAAFPARFGGRLSSIIDINTKEGSTKKRNMELGVGLINSKFLWEGPLGKPKNNAPTFFIGARVSNLALAMLPSYIYYRKTSFSSYFGYGMFDLNAKLNKKFKDNSQLFFSSYFGVDNWNVKNKQANNETYSNSYLKWGNFTSSLRYVKPLNQKLFFKSTAAITKYNYGIGSEEIEANNSVGYFDSKSTIRDYIFKNSLEYYLNNENEFRLGLDLIQHQFIPIELKTNFDFNNPNNNAKINTFERGLFFEVENKLASWAHVNYGFRLATYNVNSETFKSWEPRFSIDFKLPYNSSFKIGYSKMTQFVHLLNSNSAGLPNDLWIPSTSSIPGEKANQIGISFSKKIRSGLSFSLEGYIKKYTNLIDYKDGQNYLTNTTQSYEETLEKNGIGEAKGIEFFLDKNKGRFTGWLAYTLSWSNRKFENINSGNWYAANYDRRHNIAVVGTYKINNSIDVSANWVLQSGSPVSVPISVSKSPISATNDPFFIYGDRNNFRLPTYHRLDLSASFKKDTKRGNERQWTVGTYNAYNNKNPFYVTVLPQGGQGNNSGWNNSLRKRSVLPFLPYLNYSIKIK